MLGATVSALFAVSCGADSAGKTTVRADTAPAWMTTDGWGSAAVATVDGDLVVVGGADDSDAGARTLGRNRQGVIVRADGTYTSFELDESLIDVHVSGDQHSVIVSGTICTKPVEDTDTGPRCGQAGAAVYQVERTTGETQRILETELEGGDDESNPGLFFFDDGVVVSVAIEGGAARLIHRRSDGSITELPRTPESLVDCSTGTTLYSSLPSQADKIPDDVFGAVDPVIGRGSGLARLQAGEAAWQPVAPPEGGFAWASRHCAKGQFFETPMLGDTTELLLLGDDGRWQPASLGDGVSLVQPVVISNPWATTFVLSSFDEEVDVTTREAGPPIVKARSVGDDRLDDRSTVISEDGRIMVLNANAQLEPVR